MCSAVIQIAREHHSREKKILTILSCQRIFKKDDYVTAKASLVIGKKNKKKSEELNHCPQKEQIINVGS